MSKDKWCSLSRRDFEHALDEIGSVIDVSVDDLIRITDKARRYAQLRHTEDTLVGGLMSRPVQTVRADTSLGEAANLLLLSKISGLPVVDSNNHLIGIITEADFLAAIGLPCHRPSHNFWQRLEGMFTRPIELHEPTENVGALMVSKVVTTSPKQSLHAAIDMMKDHQVKRLVVVDDKRTPIGMLTRSDLVRVFFERIRSTEHVFPSSQSSEQGRHA